MWTRRAPRRLRFLAGPPAPVQRDVGSDPVSPGYCCPLVPGLTPTRALGRVGRVFWRGPTDPPGLAAPRPRRAPGPRSSGPRTCSAANAKTPGDLRGRAGWPALTLPSAVCRARPGLRGTLQSAVRVPDAACPPGPRSGNAGEQGPPGHTAGIGDAGLGIPGGAQQRTDSFIEE